MEQSLSRLAEDFVRTGDGDSLQWEGARLRTHFQPIYCVRREACVGHEALVRATDAAGVAIPPTRLLGAAFAANNGVLLDWVCRALHLRNFARMDPGDRKLFINVHPAAAVRDASCTRDLGDLIRFYGVSPRRLCVEILEDGCADEGLLREAVAAYRALGAGIAMDDFGSGCSNFDRIVRLRPDIVKIDRNVLVAAVGDAKSRRMLPAFVELVHAAGAKVVLEGIESATEALIAVDSGADHLQGYYLAAPSPALVEDGMTDRIVARLVGLRSLAMADG